LAVAGDDGLAIGIAPTSLRPAVTLHKSDEALLNVEGSAAAARTGRRGSPGARSSKAQVWRYQRASIMRMEGARPWPHGVRARRPCRPCGTPRSCAQARPSF